MRSALATAAQCCAIPSQRRAAATPARLRQGASASCNCACGRYLCLSARSLRNAQACHMKSFRILPKIVVKYPHRHESSARIHDSLQANAMHYENTCAERFIYKFSGDDVKQNWTKCTQTTTSFVSLLQGHARGKPPDAQEGSELQVHERKHKCHHLSLSFNKSQRLSLSLSTSMRPSTSTRRSPSAIT